MKVPPPPLTTDEESFLKKYGGAIWYVVVIVWFIGVVFLNEIFFIQGPNRSNPYCYLSILWTIFCLWKWLEISGRSEALEAKKLEYESYMRRLEEHKARKKEKRRFEKLKAERDKVIEQHLSSVKERAGQLIPFAKKIFPEARYFKHWGDITAWEQGTPSPSSKEEQFSFTTDIGNFACEDILERSDESIDKEIVSFRQYGQTGYESGSNSESSPKPNKVSQICEEKWDILCSGKGNVRHDGKWMCYHCQREHEQFWVYDDS